MLGVIRACPTRSATSRARQSPEAESVARASCGPCCSVAPMVIIAVVIPLLRAASISFHVFFSSSCWAGAIGADSITKTNVTVILWSIATSRQQ